MTLTEKVANSLGVDINTAAAVFNLMCESRIRFSSCTTREFNISARESYKAWKKQQEGESK